MESAGPPCARFGALRLLLGENRWAPGQAGSVSTYSSEASSRTWEVELAARDAVQAQFMCSTERRADATISSSVEH